MQWHFLMCFDGLLSLVLCIISFASPLCMTPHCVFNSGWVAFKMHSCQTSGWLGWMKDSGKVCVLSWNNEGFHEKTEVCLKQGRTVSKLFIIPRRASLASNAPEVFSSKIFTEDHRGWKWINTFCNNNSNILNQYLNKDGLTCPNGHAQVLLGLAL